ncbi:MAG: cytidylate kinase-like family protein [Lachnospiraceae bacterium]|nr:cytidylate kinase-like family protein [Lachnospiraceae bacterium]
MNSKYKVVTIGREYGAGGRTVARGLSEKLGIPFYDKDIVRLTAEKSGFSEDEIKEEGEEISYFSGLFNRLLRNSSAYSSSYDAIFDAQVKMMMEIVSEPCIIVGRCSNIIFNLANIPSFDVFLFADIEKRIKRAEELKEYGKMDIRKYVEKRDSERDNFYKMYTKRQPGMIKDYDISLNTGDIGMDKCVDILYDILK